MVGLWHHVAVTLRVVTPYFRACCLLFDAWTRSARVAWDWGFVVLSSRMRWSGAHALASLLGAGVGHHPGPSQTWPHSLTPLHIPTHSSHLSPQSHPTPHTLRLTPHASRLTPHASRLTPHTSLLSLYTAQLEKIDALTMVKEGRG
eukprot:3411115-Rhodomonas_salina.2